VSDPKPDDPAIQLRALRFTLGRNFKPITGDQLAALIHIPPVAIRAVENGRRKFNDDDRFNIEWFVGAVWDEKSHQWMTTWDQTPLTREKYDSYIGDKLRDRERNPNREREAMRAEYHRLVDLYLDELDPPIADLGLAKLTRDLRRNAKQDDVDLEALAEKKRKARK